MREVTSLSTAKEILYRVKTQPTMGESIGKSHTQQQIKIENMQKIPTTQQKRINNLINKCTEDSSRQFSKEDYQLVYVVNIINYQGNVIKTTMTYLICSFPGSLLSSSWLWVPRLHLLFDQAKKYCRFSLSFQLPHSNCNLF